MVSENSLRRYILELDLEYPDKLHELHNDYPLASEKLKNSRDMLSRYCSDIADQYGINVGGINKLVPNFAAIDKIKLVLTLDKPICAGFSILDLSNLLMYQFHCKYIGVKYGSGAKLLLTDTDGLVYETETSGVHENFYEDKSLFNFSYYPKDLGFYDPVNKKVIGKLKDEVRGSIINEFLGLKSMMYSVVMVDDWGIKKAKGVNKNVVNSIRHKIYVDMLFGRGLIRHSVKRIQSKLHRNETYDVCKISLLCFDDKYYIFDDGVNSLVYFHRDVLGSY